MSVSLINPGDFAIFNTNDYVTALTGVKADVNGNPLAVLRKDVRFAYENKPKSEWQEIVNGSINLTIDPDKKVYIDFRFTLISTGPVTIDNVRPILTYDKIVKDKFLGFEPVTICCQSGNVSSITKLENFTFNPYRVNPAVALYQNLSYTINQMFGHDVSYARANPIERGKDFTLHEWTLYDVEEPVYVKVLVPNNEFPDNKINFGPYGMDFDMPFEVHIVKKYFEDLFGVGKGPQKGDIIYFPFTNRIYEVGSSYLFRDFMQQDAYWKVALVKYAPKSNRKEPTDLREALDGLSWDSEERFDEELKNDALKKTRPEQYDQRLGNYPYDPVRLRVNDKLNVSTEKFMNYHTLISDSQYDLRSIYTTKNSPVAITYKIPAIFESAEDRAYMAWFKDIAPKIQMISDSLQAMGNAFFAPLTTGFDSALQMDYIDYAVKINAARAYDNYTLMKFSRFNGITGFGYWMGYVNQPASIYRLRIPVDCKNFLDIAYPNWTLQNGYKIQSTQEKVFLDGFKPSSNTGWKLVEIARRYFMVYSNEKRYLFPLQDDLQENSWYGVWLNISNTYGQIVLDVWERKWNEKVLNPSPTTDLMKIYTKSYSNITPIDRTAQVTTAALSIATQSDSYEATITSGIGYAVGMHLESDVYESGTTIDFVEDTTIKTSKLPKATGTFTAIAHDPDATYQLPASELLLTNIRLFKECETDDAQKMFLFNQNIVQDAHLAILVDNALPPLHMPWIGQTK